jgi:hypothetical protein
VRCKMLDVAEGSGVFWGVAWLLGFVIGVGLVGESAGADPTLARRATRVGLINLGFVIVL